jgi:hypothetical protein
MRPIRALLVLSALVCAAASCAAPLQNGNIQVLPGAEARLDAMCRYRLSADGAQDACVSGPGE